MSTTLSGFRLTQTDFSFVGLGLTRPECVLVQEDGVWVSDNRGGVARLVEGAAPELLGRGILEPNGFTRRRNGAFVVAGLSDGALHEVAPNGDTRTLLDSIDGHPLGTVNYAWVDREDRIWVSVMTHRPRWFEAIAASAPEGYIVLIDGKGPRVVADSINLTNEIKVSPDGGFLYAAETFSRRILRFPIEANGDLGPREVVGPPDLGHGGFPDGFAFDADGNVWVTLITRNGISVITRDGELLTIYEEVKSEALDRFVSGLADATGTAEQMGACAGDFLRLPTSLAFGGPDRKSVFVGSLLMPSLPCFRSPVAGAG